MSVYSLIILTKNLVVSLQEQVPGEQNISYAE